MIQRLLLLLLPFALFAGALRPGRVLSGADVLLLSPPWSAWAPGVAPKNPLLLDVAWLQHPWLIHAAREIQAGRFPLWNPDAFTGAPFFGNAQSALLFPLNALAWLLPLPLAVTLIPILKLSAAGLAMDWFLRGLALGRWPACVGGLVFMLNGGLAVWLQWPLANVMIALPLVLGATERVRVRGDGRSVARLALVVALAGVAGYPQAAVYGLAVTAAWALHRARGAAGGAWFLARAAAGGALGIALAAVQLLPFAEYATESSALVYRAQWMPVQTLPWRAAIALLLPYYYGSPSGGDFWGDWNFNEMTASVGLVPWLLAPAALALAWRRRETRFFAALAGLALITFYELPLGVSLASLPVLSLVTTTRVVAFLALAMAALAAIGLDAIASAPAAGRRRARVAVQAVFGTLVLLGFLSILDDAALFRATTLRIPIGAQYVTFVGLLTLTALAILPSLRGVRSAAGAAMLVAVQLAATAPLVITANPAIETRLFYPAPPPAVAHLQRRAGDDPGRVLLGEAKNLGALYGLAEVTGYDGLTPRRIEQVASPAADLGLTGSGALNVTTGAGSPVFDLLGIRRVLTGPGAPAPAPHFALEYDGADARIFRNDRALPRAFLVARARTCVGERETLGLLHGGAVDVRAEALIAACDAPPLAGAGSPGRAGIASAEPHRVVVRTEDDHPSYLVLTDTWFPGWEVRVDGRRERLERANHAFRAVALGPGRHEVEFSYRPPALRYGLAITLVAGGIIAVLGARRRRSPAPIAGLALLGLLLLPPGAEAGLERAPFVLDVFPSTLQAGEPATLQLSPRRAAPGDRVDVYVARFSSRTPASHFLTASGAWQPAPVPYRQDVAAAEMSPAAARWREPGPGGWFSLVVVFVRAGADPRHREHWRFQPIMAKIRVEPGGDAGGSGALLVPLGVLAVAAGAAVTLFRGSSDHDKKLPEP